MLEYIVVNYSATGIRRETRGGREIIIAPVSMIVEGVLTGSEGSLFYPADEIKKNPSAWNGMPVTANHPYIGNKPVSARSPDIEDSHRIGTVFNTTFNGKLVAEAHIDVENARSKDARILDALENGEPIELSTGLVVDTELSSGVFNGKSYDAIARNYRPDHLAILYGQKGACSIRDGCGVLVNEEASTLYVIHVLNSDGEVEEVVEETELVANKSLDDIRRELVLQLQADRFSNGFLEEVFLSGFIYSQDGKLWRLGYKVKGEILTISDAPPEQVQVFKRYVPVNPVHNNKESEMDRDKLINDLIANCDCWDEGDRPVLNKLSDAKLQATHDYSVKVRNNEAVANAARKGFEDGDTKFTFNEESGEFVKTEETPPVVNESETKTFEQWMADAPTQVQQVVTNALEWQNAQKEEHIEKILANKANVFSKPQLQAKSLEDLRAISSLASTPVTPAPAGTPNFTGAAAAPTVNQGAPAVEEEALPMPVINWAETNED
jgi:hypothetical protein